MSSVWSEVDSRTAGETVAAFLDALGRWGFVEFLAASSADVPEPVRWARAARTVRDDLRRLVGLLLLGEPQPVADLVPEVAAAVPLLVEHGAAVVDGGSVHLADVALFRPRDVWLLAQPPSIVETRSYFGADSVALARRVVVRAPDRCLDLCAGTGFQGLSVAPRCRRTTMVEILPDVARLAELNVLLNGLSDRVDVRCGDLYAPLPLGARYDLVVANIPFLPNPYGGEPGVDGFGLGRRLLRGLPAVLSKRGTAHMTALLLQAGGNLVIEPELREWATSSGRRVTVGLADELAIDVGSDLIQAIVWNGGEPAPGDADRLVATYRGRGATRARLAFLRIEAGNPGVDVLDICPDPPA